MLRIVFGCSSQLRYGHHTPGVEETKPETVDTFQLNVYATTEATCTRATEDQADIKPEVLDIWLPRLVLHHRV